MTPTACARYDHVAGAPGMAAAMPARRAAASDDAVAIHGPADVLALRPDLGREVAS